MELVKNLNVRSEPSSRYHLIQAIGRLVQVVEVIPWDADKIICTWYVSSYRRPGRTSGTTQTIPESLPLSLKLVRWWSSIHTLVQEPVVKIQILVLDRVNQWR